MGKTSYIATPSVWGTGKSEPPLVSGRRRELRMLVAIIKITSPSPNRGFGLELAGMGVVVRSEEEHVF